MRPRIVAGLEVTVTKVPVPRVKPALPYSISYCEAAVRLFHANVMLLAVAVSAWKRRTGRQVGA